MILTIYQGCVHSISHRMNQENAPEYSKDEILDDLLYIFPKICLTPLPALYLGFGDLSIPEFQSHFTLPTTFSKDDSANITNNHSFITKNSDSFDPNTNLDLDRDQFEKGIILIVSRSIIFTL